MKIVCMPDGLPLDYTIQLANSLSRKAEVMLVLLNTQCQQDLTEQIQNINKDIYVCCSKEIKPPFRTAKKLSELIDILYKIRMFNPDIIHIQNGDLLSTLISLLLNNIILVTTIHDVRFHRGQAHLLNKLIRLYSIKRSQALFVLGFKLKEEAINEFGIPKDKIHVIPMGEINVKPFIKYMDDKIEEDSSILFFGWIGIRKGLEYLIKAEPIISKMIPDIKIIIAGNIGYPKDYFRKCMDSIINTNNFEIYPHNISWEFGAELFQRSSVVVLPYIEASHSGVIPCAYGFKKPVVVTDVGSIPEIVDEGITGYIVPPRDTEALANAIIKLLKNTELRKQMGINAHKKLKTDLSWDNIADKTLEVYNSILTRNKNDLKR